MSGESIAREEERRLADLTNEISQWFASPRFKHTKRPYTAAQVASLRGTIQDVPASGYTAKKLYGMLRTGFERGEYHHTFGALDPVQVVQMAKYLSCVYVSGWQCSSTASTSNEPGPGRFFFFFFPAPRDRTNYNTPNDDRFRRLSRGHW